MLFLYSSTPSKVSERCWNRSLSTDEDRNAFLLDICQRTYQSFANTFYVADQIVNGTDPQDASTCSAVDFIPLFLERLSKLKSSIRNWRIWENSLTATAQSQVPVFELPLNGENLEFEEIKLDWDVIREESEIPRTDSIRTTGRRHLQGLDLRDFPWSEVEAEFFHHPATGPFRHFDGPLSGIDATIPILKQIDTLTKLVDRYTLPCECVAAGHAVMTAELKRQLESGPFLQMCCRLAWASEAWRRLAGPELESFEKSEWRNLNPDMVSQTDWLMHQIGAYEVAMTEYECLLSQSPFESVTQGSVGAQRHARALSRLFTLTIELSTSHHAHKAWKALRAVDAVIEECTARNLPSRHSAPPQGNSISLSGLTDDAIKAVYKLKIWYQHNVNTSIAWLPIGFRPESRTQLQPSNHGPNSLHGQGAESSALCSAGGSRSQHLVPGEKHTRLYDIAYPKRLGTDMIFLHDPVSVMKDIQRHLSRIRRQHSVHSQPR